MNTGALMLRLLVCCLVTTSCVRLSGPDCIDETRGFSASARLGSVVANPLPGDTGTAQVSLYEARNFNSKATSAQEISWFVGSGLARSSVTAVHIHELGTDRLLFSFPLDQPVGPPYVITRVFTRQPYTGPVSWNELYQLIGSERTYVDIHTVASPGGQLRGALHRENPNWEIFSQAFCS